MKNSHLAQNFFLKSAEQTTRYYSKFQIENAGGIQVGEITKKWRGCCAESFTDTDTFKIDFPDNADVTTKAILMGATMLVVSLHFAHQPKRREVFAST